MKTNLDFISLQVKELESSARFYKTILGLEETEEKRPDAVVFKDDAGAIFAIRKPLFEITEGMSLGLGVSIWFNINNLDQIFKRVKEANATIISPPVDGPFGRMFIIQDPDGYMLTFHQF